MEDAKNLDLSGSRGVFAEPISKKSGRISRAQRVVEAAQRTSAENVNVHKLPSTRLEHGVANLKKTLTAIFPKKGGGKSDRLDLSFLLDFPGLTDLFAHGMLAWLKTQAHFSRIQKVSALERSWFAYLLDKSLADILPAQLDEQVLSGFNIWLHQRVKQDGKPISPNTIRVELGHLRCALREAPGAENLLTLVPAGRRGVGAKTEPTNVLQFDQLLSVMAAVEKEVLALRDRVEERRNLLEAGRAHLRDGKTLCPYVHSKNQGRMNEVRTETNLAMTMAMLDTRYPGIFPYTKQLMEDDYLLGRTVTYVFGLESISGYFYASARDLVPLILSIGLATAFNPETLLKLRWKNIDRNVDRLSNGNRSVEFDVKEIEEESNSQLIKITAGKPRAHRHLVRLLDPESTGTNQVSLNLVLDILVTLTSRLRPVVSDHERYGDSVFLYVPITKQRIARGFDSADSSAAENKAFKNALKQFIDDNKLPSFSLKTIRSTLLDYVQLFNQGDLEAARQVGNHSARTITWTHYTSNLVKRLLQESTGETLLVRERWLESGGKLDPRKYRGSTTKGCATPGWICLDPFDSPRPNQKAGRLCNGYGECPDCPLSAARPDNPSNVMLYEALHRAIYRSIKNVTATVWRERWAPVVAALDGLLANVSHEVLQESRKFTVELPDIG